MKDDLISRADAIHVVSGLDSSFVKYIEELPPAQPKPCEDCVSRKAVIRLLHSGYHSKSMIEEVKELPSVQPEIIVCADCKHWICHDRRCGYWNHGVKPLEWCCHAERRTNE